MSTNDIYITEIIVRFHVSPDHGYPSGPPERRELSLENFIDRHGKGAFWGQHSNWLKRHAADLASVD